MSLFLSLVSLLVAAVLLYMATNRRRSRLVWALLLSIVRPEQGRPLLMRAWAEYKNPPRPNPLAPLL